MFDIKYRSSSDIKSPVSIVFLYTYYVPLFIHNLRHRFNIHNILKSLYFLVISNSPNLLKHFFHVELNLSP